MPQYHERSSFTEYHLTKKMKNYIWQGQKITKIPLEKKLNPNTHVPLYTDTISMYSITYDPLPSCDLENDLTAGTNPQTVKWCGASFFIFYFLFIV